MLFLRQMHLPNMFRDQTGSMIDELLSYSLPNGLQRAGDHGINLGREFLLLCTWGRLAGCYVFLPDLADAVEFAACAEFSENLPGFDRIAAGLFSRFSPAAMMSSCE